MMKFHFRRPTSEPLRQILSVASLAGIMAMVSGGPGWAEPLLVPGKSDLYQRVLTRPGAEIVPEANAEDPLDTPATFSAYYVFDRTDSEGEAWLEIGPARSQDPVGWISESQTVSWNSTIVLAFENPSGRLPVLFFEDLPSLRDLVESERLPVLAPDYVEQARSGEISAGLNLVSIEPEEHVDLTENFYLLPVLEAEQTFLSSGFRATLVRVASIPLSEEDDRDAVDDEFRAGIVFVVDSTISMQPYIDRTLRALNEIHETISNSDIGDYVSFGLIEYRDNIEASPDLDYATRIVSNLEIPPDHDQFIRDIEDVTVSSASSSGFNEDALAGALTALNLEEWKHFGARYVIMITDAGMREPPDPLATTGMAAREINTLARERSTAIFSLLLATPEGEAYHSNAERQMEELSYWNDCNPSLSYSVPNGAVDDFGPTVDQLTRRLISQIEDAREAVSAGTATRSSSGCGPAADGASDRDAFLSSAEDIGHAMQMAWLGRSRGTEAPDVFEAWAADFALNNPASRALQVRVLLTKEQLSRMAAAMELTLEAGEASLDEGGDQFFEQLQTVVARATRDPSMIDAGTPGATHPDDIENLGDLLGEYLDDLPYQSQIAEISRDAWLDMGAAGQDQILTSIRSKLSYYQVFHDDVDRWVALTEGVPDDERVYPIPMDVLP